jgi:trigger factor
VQAEVNRHLEAEDRLDDDEHRAEVTIEATDALRRQILLDTLAEKLAVKVSQAELVDYLVGASRRYGMDPNTFISTLDQQGQIPAMVGEVARGKALAVALRQVAVVDGAGRAVDLTEYIGSDEQDAAAEAAAAAVSEAADELAADEAAAAHDAPAEATDAATDISAALRD